MRYEITVDFKKKTLRIRSPLLGNNGLLSIINLYFNGRICLMNHKNKALGRLICLLNLYIYIYIYMLIKKKSLTIKQGIVHEGSNCFKPCATTTVGNFPR